MGEARLSVQAATGAPALTLTVCASTRRARLVAVATAATDFAHVITLPKSAWHPRGHPLPFATQSGSPSWHLGEPPFSLGRGTCTRPMPGPSLPPTTAASTGAEQLSLHRARTSRTSRDSSSTAPLTPPRLSHATQCPPRGAAPSPPLFPP